MNPFKYTRSLKYIAVCSCMALSSICFAQKKNAALDIKPKLFALTRVMMHDVVNPPAASRYYAYCMLSAYEIMAHHDPAQSALLKLIRSYPPVEFTTGKDYDYRIAAVYSILETGRLLLPSGYTLEADEIEYTAALQKQQYSKQVIQNSIAIAKLVSEKIVKWSRTDNYFKLSTLLRYTPKKGDQYWFPTPPAYIEAVEPNWKTVRPMLIDSCNQFIPKPPTPFSKDSSSAFYKLAKEVYAVSSPLSPAQKEIAGFWDCNPFAISTAGHMSIGFKKMSPGGHWMNITGIVCAKAGFGFDKAISVHTVVALTLMDAFISCWDEKYRSNRIRPETYINRYIDPRWQPLLQTPPFPEYTSGHSVISSAAAEVLSCLVGDTFTFTDDSEIMFELTPRTFHSFREAAAEAAISRLYGGIHYRDAIENGVEQGKLLGQFVVQKIKKGR